MDIFEFAMEKEKYAEQYYRQLADRTDHSGLKGILTMLADEEVKHFQIMQQMQANTSPDIMETAVLQNAQAVFTRMKEAADKFSFDISEVNLYRKARDFEAASKKFYLEKAQEVDDAKQKEIFEKLAEEENKHLLLVQRLCDFVAKPETFLEDAEFYHFNDYADGQF